MTKSDAIKLLYEKPVKIAKLIGFDKLIDLHNEWIKSMLMSNTDKTLQAHRGSYKTTCLTIALPIIIITQPQRTILFARKTDTDVKEIKRQIEKILKSDVMQYIINSIWNKSLDFTTLTQNEINTNLVQGVSGTSQLTAFGINGSMTGKHYDYIFTDDIVNIEDRTSRAEREHTKLIYQELQNVKNRDGRIYNTGTPWHKDDCFTLMPKADKYDCYTTGLISNTELKKIRKDMTSSLFAANYELRHIASDKVIFTNPQYAEYDGLVEQGIDHIDSAYGGEDYTAYTILKKCEEKYYVFGKIWQKRIDELEDIIMAYHNQFMVGKMYTETNADKGFVAKEMESKGARVYEYYEHQNKYIKIVTYLKKVWDRVYFVPGTDREYINQIIDFNDNAEHDDAPDSLASLIRQIDSGDSFSFD